MVTSSLEADVLRTSECGDAASKRPLSRSHVAAIADDEPWLEAVDAFRVAKPRRRDRIAEYERLLERQVHRRVGEAVLDGSYQPHPPVEGWLNKAGGRRKRLFQYGPVDELLFRVVNRLLQPAALAAASPSCRSFLPGSGPRAAFRAVLRDREVDTKAWLRLDVRDYFNSIDVEDLLGGLPEAIAEGPLGSLLARSLRDPRVQRGSTIIDGRPKGIMAGTPIAPMLATLYLRDIDEELRGTSDVTYARYSDDFIVLAPIHRIGELERLLRTRLAERSLTINEDKSATGGPGEPWSFLGFQRHRGVIGMAANTERKFRAKSRRLARALLRWREKTGASPDRTVRAFMRRTNRRIYGSPVERTDFSWATWFLPMLEDPSALASLDEHLQREARYAATGRRTGRALALVPYSSLTEAGHLPLVAAYWAMREGVPSYETLVARRAGLA